MSLNLFKHQHCKTVKHTESILCYMEQFLIIKLKLIFVLSISMTENTILCLEKNYRFVLNLCLNHYNTILGYKQFIRDTFHIGKI